MNVNAHTLTSSMSVMMVKSLLFLLPYNTIIVHSPLYSTDYGPWFQQIIVEFL